MLRYLLISLHLHLQHTYSSIKVTAPPKSKLGTTIVFRARLWNGEASSWQPILSTQEQCRYIIESWLMRQTSLPRWYLVLLNLYQKYAFLRVLNVSFLFDPSLYRLNSRVWSWYLHRSLNQQLSRKMLHWALNSIQRAKETRYIPLWTLHYVFWVFLLDIKLIVASLTVGLLTTLENQQTSLSIQSQSYLAVHLNSLEFRYRNLIFRRVRRSRHC